MKQLIRSRGTQPPTAEAELATYRELIKLDRHALDIATEEQAQLFLTICDKHTYSISLRDQAEEALATVDAEVSSKIRQRASETKLTEAAIKEQVVLAKEHAAAVADYEYKRRISNYWGNLRAAFDQRAKMIRELTGQYSAGYFTVQSAVSARRNGAAEGRDAMQKARTNREA